MQRKASNADVEACANAGQAMKLVGEGLCYCACFYSHLQQHRHIQSAAFTSHK